MKNETANIKIENDHLFVSGEINFSNVMELWKNSLSLLPCCKQLTFDFSNVTTTNSAALALLLEWVKYALRVSKPISFQHLPPKLLSIAEAAGMVKLITRM